MPKQHTVERGECLSSLAFEHGFAIATIWDDPANAGLKERRTSPHVLLAGDVLTLPDVRVKQVPCATGARHTFRRKDVPELLRRQFLDEAGKPRAGLSYTLEVDGVESAGTTDADGKIEHPIRPDAKRGLLVLDGSEELELELGALDPVEEESGARARLLSLGYLEVDDPEDAHGYESAVLAFQIDHELAETGALDDETRAKLRETYGC